MIACDPPVAAGHGHEGDTVILGFCDTRQDADELLRARNETELLRLAQEAFYVRLYQQGAISSARAATQLGLGRVAFLDLLGAYGVSYFDEETDLAEDVRNADQARS